MPTNDFLPFAVDVNAGVMSQADYAERAGLGVVPGIADPDFANKAWRQAANMAAALGEMIKAQGIDALDNGEIASLSSNIISALKSFLLPLSGGTLTGNLTLGGTNPVISTGAATDYLRLNNGAYSDGASLYIYGKSHPTYPGKFWLTALDDNNNAQLAGSPDGALTWKGNDVEVVSAKNLGTVGYVYYKSGLQICWGFNTSPTTGGTGNTVTYPRAFKTPPTTFVTRRSGASTTGPADPPWVREPTATGMNVYVPTYTGYYWLAIGEGA